MFFGIHDIDCYSVVVYTSARLLIPITSRETGLFTFKIRIQYNKNSYKSSKISHITH